MYRFRVEERGLAAEEGGAGGQAQEAPGRRPPAAEPRIREAVPKAQEALQSTAQSALNIRKQLESVRMLEDCSKLRKMEHYLSISTALEPRSSGCSSDQAGKHPSPTAALRGLEALRHLLQALQPCVVEPETTRPYEGLHRTSGGRGGCGTHPKFP